MLKSLLIKIQKKRFKYLLQLPKRYIQMQHVSNDQIILERLKNRLKVSTHEAEYIIKKYPSISRLEDDNLCNILRGFLEIGIDKNDIVTQPKILGHCPVTVKNRREILQECGVNGINIDVIFNYLPITRNKTVSQLKNEKLLPKNIKVAKRLFSYLSDQSNEEHNLNEKNLTLFEIRMKVLETYLNQHLGSTIETLKKDLSKYPAIKRKSLKSIKETMLLLQSELNMPPNKLRSYFSFINSDPDNIKKLIQLESIAGVNIREILKSRPALCNTKYETFREINHVLDEYKISEDARLKCLPIYMLSSETVRRRFLEAKLIPEFEIMFHHPRILRIIVYFEQAKSRLIEIRESRKICPSLHTLLDMNKSDYKAHLKAPGDKTRGKDLIQGLKSSFRGDYTDSEIRKKLKKHPFWCKIPFVEAKLVFDNLIKSYSEKDIFLNFCLLLYPWQKTEEILNKVFLFSNNNFNNEKEILSLFIGIKINKLNPAQILSLILYILEKDHYFSGNGVWLKPITS